MDENEPDRITGGFIFWSLAPCFLISALAFPLLVVEWETSAILGGILWTTCCLLTIPALYDVERYNWAARGVTGIIGFVCSSYLYESLFHSEEYEDMPVMFVGGIACFICFGKPSILYTLFRRTTFFVQAEEFPLDEIVDHLLELRPDLFSDGHYIGDDFENDYLDATYDLH